MHRVDRQNARSNVDSISHDEREEHVSINRTALLRGLDGAGDGAYKHVHRQDRENHCAEFVLPLCAARFVAEGKEEASDDRARICVLR